MISVVSVLLALLALGFGVVGLIGFFGWRRRMRDPAPGGNELTTMGLRTNADA
jgi:hypothetical protein